MQILLVSDLHYTLKQVGDRQWIWVYHAPPDASPFKEDGSWIDTDAGTARWSSLEGVEERSFAAV